MGVRPDLPGDTYTAVFASDLNNCRVPKKGFDLVTRAHGRCNSGRERRVLSVRLRRHAIWPCDAGLVCKGTCRQPAKKKEPADLTVFIVRICVFAVFINAGAAYMVYMHLEHQKQIDAMAQERKTLVRLQGLHHDYIPEGHSTQQAAVDVSSPGTWYLGRRGGRDGPAPAPPHEAAALGRVRA